MTPRYDYAIAVGSDQTSLTYFESIFLNITGGNPIAPKSGSGLIPLGSVQRVTLNQQRQTNGTKIIQLSIAACSWADFERYILMIHGGWDTESVAVTLDTRGRDNVFHRGNAVAILPLAGQDYTRREFGNVEDLTLEYRDFQELSSAFSTAFDMSFEA